MLTQNKKAEWLNTLSTFALLASIVINAFVFERLIAGVFKLYKFNFDWPSPIYLNMPTVLLFFFVMVCFISLGYYLARVSADLNVKTAQRFRASVFFNFAAVGILSTMLLFRLAVVSM